MNQEVLLVHYLVSQKNRRGIFCVILANVFFLRRLALLAEIAEKSSWHFLWGHLNHRRSIIQNGHQAT